MKKLSKSDIKFRNKPWINSKMQKMMCIRDRLLGKLRKNNDGSLKDLCKKFYFHNYFLNNSNNMKQLWSGINSVINTKKSSNINITKKLKDSNGNITSDSVVIKNLFNKFFVNVSHNITKNIPRTDKSPFNFMGDQTRNSFLWRLQLRMKYLR